MLKIKRQQKHKTIGGLLNTIISLSSFSLFLYNLLEQVSKNKDLLQGWYFTIPFLVIGILGLLLKQSMFVEIVFLTLGIGFLITTPSMSNVLGLIFIIPCFHINRTRINFVIVSFVMVTSIGIKSILYDASISNTLGVIIGFLCISFVYAWVFSPKTLPSLTIEESKMLEYLSKGDSQKTAGVKLGMDRSQANYCVKNIRLKCECQTIYEVLYLYGKANS